MSGRKQIIQVKISFKCSECSTFHVEIFKSWRQTNTPRSCLLRRRHWNLCFRGNSPFHGTLLRACQFRRWLRYLWVLLVFVSYFWLRRTSLGTPPFGWLRFCCRSQKLPVSSEELITWFDYIWSVWKFPNTGSFFPRLVLPQGLNSDFLTILQFR